ncbi:MAG: thiamine-phosphate kinase [Acidimicrobiales bacterium]
MPGEATEDVGRGEADALARLRRLLPEPPPGETWMGDDAAVLRVAGSERSMLLATDTVVAGVDADLDLTTLGDLGWKAMAVNLSDIAAMGGLPWCAVVSVVGLGGTDLEELYAGALEAADRYSCPVVGGDLSGGGQVVVTVAITGWSDRPVLRNGARPGDAIWVTAPLGAAAAGLRLLRDQARRARPAPGASRDPLEGASADRSALARAHARPRPALDEGLAARDAGATAMIDVSDGFGVDLGHLAAGSGVGLELSEVPVAAGATEEEAMGGGDDYVLAFTLPPGKDPLRLFRARGLTAPSMVGRCTTDPGRRRYGGKELVAGGWEHRL